MPARPEYVALQALSERMREAAEAEHWQELDRLHAEQSSMLPSLPTPTVDDRPHLERALAELTAATACAASRREQIGILLKAFGGKAGIQSDT